MNNDTPTEPEKPKLEIAMPTTAEMRALGIQSEVAKDQLRPMAPDQNYYRTLLGPSTGDAVYGIVMDRQIRVAKCLKERALRVFMRDWFRFVERRAAEIGYRYEDVEVEGGVTPSGQIHITVKPKIGAMPL